MRAKTKLQDQVVKLFEATPPLSKTKEAWAKDRLFKHYYYENKDNLTCMECGHRWDKIAPVKGRYCRCPECNISLEKWRFCGRKGRSNEMFMVIEHIKGFQVARYFEMDRQMKVLQPAQYELTEVVNQWLSPDGKMTPFSRLGSGFYYGYANYSPNSSFELRSTDRYYHNCIMYPKYKLHPNVYRNGYDGSDHGFHIMYLSKILLAYPHAETMLKTGRWDLFDMFKNYEVQYKKYWKYMVIAWRHGFDIEKDLTMWFDHLDLLTFLKLDRHNPHYVAPKNFKKQHSELSDKRTRIWAIQAAEQDRLEKEERLRRQKELNDTYQKEYGKFFDLSFNLDKHTQIVVLKDVDDFIEEGRALHHCVGEYIGKKDSLILSARHKDKRIETVQFDLKEMKILQARGACNEDSKYHNKIIDTITMKAELIRKLAKTG